MLALLSSQEPMQKLWNKLIMAKVAEVAKRDEVDVEGHLKVKTGGQNGWASTPHHMAIAGIMELVSEIKVGSG